MGFRIREEVAVPLVGKDDKLRITISVGQDLRPLPVTDFAGDVSIVLSHQDQRGLLAVFHSPAGVVALTQTNRK